MKKSFPIFCFLFTWIFGTAQIPEEVSLAAKKQQTIVTEPVTTYKGFLRAGLGTHYNVTDKVFLDSRKESQPENLWGTTFYLSIFAQYGISDRLMAEVLVPYVRDNIYRSVVYELPFDVDDINIYPQRWKTQAKGFGDIDVALGYQLLEETISRPALAAFVTITLPTGQKDVVDDGDENLNTFERPTGQGQFALNTKLRLRQIKYPFSYSVDAAYKFGSGSTKVVSVNEPRVAFRNGNLLGFSGSFNYHLNNWIVLRNIMDYIQNGKDTLDGDALGEKGWLIAYQTGFSFQLKRLRLDQGVTVPVIGNNVPADPAYFLIMQYTF